MKGLIFNSIRIDQSWYSLFDKNVYLLNNIYKSIGKNYTPKENSIFKIFEQSIDNIRFVIVGQDPYNQPGHATGRSFERNVASWKEACSKNSSLKGILCSLFYYEFDELINIAEVISKADNGEWKIAPPNLFFKSWEKNKGVLFLNKSLTTEIDISNSHKHLWTPFTEKVVKYISRNEKILWLLWGRDAEELTTYINPKSTIIKTNHPASFSYVDGKESLKRMRKFILNSGLDHILKFDHHIKTEISKQNELDAQIHELDLEVKRLKSLKEKKEITLFIDPLIESLEKEILLLETELLRLESEKVEAEKLISDYNFRFNIELGNLILEILKLKKLIAQEDSKEYKEAKENEERFKYQFINEQQRELIQLSEEEKKRIKSLRNEAVKLCHPDKFHHESEEVKQRSKQISQDLNDAYRNNDLKKVEQILKLLMTGELYFSDKSGKIAKLKLTEQLEYLKFTVEELRIELNKLKESEVYRKIITIQDMDKYFNKIKEELVVELISLKEQFNL
jgi:uracil DNA glycosylase